MKMLLFFLLKHYWPGLKAYDTARTVWSPHSLWTLFVGIGGISHPQFAPDTVALQNEVYCISTQLLSAKTVKTNGSDYGRTKLTIFIFCSERQLVSSKDLDQKI